MHHRHRTFALAASLLLPLLAAVPVGAPAAAQPRPAEPSIGTWSVERAGPGTWQVGWTSPTPLSVGGDLPSIVGSEAGRPVGTAALSVDARTVTVTVSGEEPDPGALDVVLSGRVLDDPARDPDAEGSARLVVPERELLLDDPGEPGDVPVVREDYELDPVQLGNMDLKTEMVGHVVKPAPGAAQADDPLVVFLHGWHASCFVGSNWPLFKWPCDGDEQVVPNHLGYDYLQELLASHGYVTVSISANAIASEDARQPDLGAQVRAELVRAHLDRWASWADEGRHSVDMRNVVLVGHSRGGEGVSRASLEIPQDAPYQVSGQVLVAPTNFARQTTLHTPTVTILPSCDGDVRALDGQRYTDRARDLTTDDIALKSSVLVLGANHNYFNTEWTPGSAALSFDDWDGVGRGACATSSASRLTAEEQRAVGKAYIAGAVRLFAADETQFLPMYDGSATEVPSAVGAAVLSHMLGGGRDARRPGQGAVPSEGATATTSLCTGATPPTDAGRGCGRYAADANLTPHWPKMAGTAPKVKALQVEWEAPGSVGGLEFVDVLDVSSSSAVDLRTVVDPALGSVRLAVRVRDDTGEAAQVVPTTGETLAALPRRSRNFGAQYWAQTLRIDPVELSQANPSLDLARVSSVELVGLSGDGRVWVLDVSAVPAELPSVPAERLPLVDLGTARVDEGPAGSHVARVPYSVVGTLETDARIRVYGAAYNHLPGGVLPVEIPAGSTGGTIAWEYRGNDRDSTSPVVGTLGAYAITGVMVRDYHGRVVIMDDDPSPRMTLRAPDDVIREGEVATFRLRLREHTAGAMNIFVVPGPADATTPSVRVDDLDPGWVEGNVWVPPGTNPALPDVQMAIYGELTNDTPVAEFGIPIRRDRRVEGAESITVRATTDTGWRSRPVTITIKDRR